MNKKAVVIVAVMVGAGVLARRARWQMESFDWEQAFARMPDNAPPKWVFRNITAIRENTDRILDLLQRERDQAGAPAEPVITL